MTIAYLRSNVESMQHKLLKISGHFTVGRAKVPEVSLCLFDVNISRRHCEFKFNPVDQNWNVTDFSSNGVTVNGIRCNKYVTFSLVDGDQIILADQKDLYSWTFQVLLTPITKVTAMKRKVTDEDEQEEAKGDKQEVAGAEKGKEDENRDTLDKFMANHTSEDNKSFTNLQVEHEKKHGEKNAWMYKDEAMYLEMKAQQMEQQAALPYKPGNSFHNPDGLEPTEAEKIEKAKNEKIIINNNNRISETPRKSDKQVDKLRKEVEQREGLAAGKVGIDGKDVVKPETPSVKNPPDIHSKVYQRIKIIEAQHLAAARARMSARTEAAAEKRRESLVQATDAVAVEQKRKEYEEALKNAKIKHKNSFIALRASILRKSNTKKLNI